MDRWLVIFTSHVEPPWDQTVVEVWAASPVRAIARARADIDIPHEWRIVTARPWPDGAEDIDAVAASMSAPR